MPRTVHRQFTGGISNEIDPQNLRDDQGEEGVDINLKGHALEPGEGVTPLTEAKHYYYRGEWIQDSEAVSFEESGVGVVKTYDSKRPQYEEIINDKDNVSRDLGPALPPGAVITGTVVSEGTRGERPAEGHHLLELPADKFGSVDTAATITDSPSLEEYKATSTQDINHVYYYNGQPYWVEKSGSTWNVKTRNATNTADITSGNITHHSGGSLFKENFFISWSERYIQTCPLANTSMSVDTFDTIDPADYGDCGSTFGFTDATATPATGKEISSLDICNGVISFTQKIETADKTGAKALTKYVDSDDERWILPRKNDAYILLLRDNWAYWDYGRDNSVLATAPNAESSGGYNDGSDDVNLITPEQTEDGTWRINSGNISTKGDWIKPRGQLKFPGYDGADYDMGMKYYVRVLPKGSWGCVKYVGTNKPEILVIEGVGKLTGEDAKAVTVTRTFSEKHLKTWRNKYQDGRQDTVTAYRLNVKVEMKFPKISGSIVWQADPIPERSVTWADFQSGKDEPLSRGSVFCSHTKTRLGTMFQGDVAKVVINDGIAANSNGVTTQGGRMQWQRTVERGHTEGNTYGLYNHSSTSGTISPLSQQAILWKNSRLFANLITAPDFYDYDLPFSNAIERLCSYVPGSTTALTIQTDAARSSVHVSAKIIGESEEIEFVEATTTNFTVGDYIRVSGGRVSGSAQPEEGRRISLNLPHKSVGNTTREYFVARIKEIGSGATYAGKLKLEAIPGFEDRYMRSVDEDCYPIITTIDVDWRGRDTSDTAIPTQKRRLISTELTNHTLLGCSHGRRWGYDGEMIEVRNSAALYTSGSGLAHKIDWDGNRIHAANTSSSALRIIYMSNNNLYSQNGLDSQTAPKSVPFSDKGILHLTPTLLTAVDAGGIVVYNPTLDVQFVKHDPEKTIGLGLKGTILDGLSVTTGGNKFVLVKYLSSDDKQYWRIVKTGTKPETAILSYDFVKPLEYDSAGKLWGIWEDSSGNYDIHTAIPIFESDIKGSWINYSSNSNAKSAWGQVMKVRLSKANKDGGHKRWLSVDWKYDSGVWNNSGTPTIGLQHESGKMVGADNEFTWYVLDAPSTLETDSQGTQIADPKFALKFKSKITRDVVFFSYTETVLPAGGATGSENRISFLNYAVAGHKFYVLNASIFDLEGSPPEELAYQLGQSDTTEESFDSSRLGRSAFLVGAPNMYNAYGPNIDFFYRASFIDKWGNESVPSPLHSEGIGPLDSPDDCIQVQLTPNFFNLDNKDITKIRLYRYGGDSSEFLFLKDIPMPTIPADADGNKNFPVYVPATGSGFAASIARKASLSPYYNLRTYHDITQLSDFLNSSMDVSATPTNIDGSWRINQVYESDGDVMYLSGIGSAGDGDTGNDGNEAQQYKHELTHSESSVTGAVAAVGQFLTGAEFLTGTKVTVVNNASNYYFSPGALTAWDPNPNNQTERGRAFEFTIPKDHTIHEVRVGGVATTAYTVTNFNGAVNEIEGTVSGSGLGSGTNNYYDDGTFKVKIDDLETWQSGQTHTDVGVFIAGNAGSPGTSGGGTGVRFRVETISENYLDNITITDMGEGYQVNDTIKITDPGSTSYTVTVKVKSVLNHDLITFDTPPAAGTNNIEIETRLQTRLAEKLNATDTTVKLTGRTGELNTKETADPDTMYFNSPRHGLKHGQKIRLSTSGSLPVRNTNANLGFDLLEDTDYWVSLTESATAIPLPDADDDVLTLYNNSSLTLSNTSRLFIVKVSGSYGVGQHYFHAYLEDDDAWPKSGVAKIGTEYISYTGISGNNLTGCVRGAYDTVATEHNISREITGGTLIESTQTLSGIGVSLTGSNNANHNWLDDSTRINHSGTYSGTAPAVGQLITHPDFPVGTKIASIDVDFFDTDTNSTSAGNCLDDGVIDRGRAYEMSLSSGHTVSKVSVGGVATTAYTVSGDTITFDTSPASGTNNIEITTVSGGTGYGTHLDNTFVSGNIGITSFSKGGHTVNTLKVNTETRSGSDGWGGGAYPNGGGLAPDTEIVFLEPPSGSTLPEGITAGTIYYVVDSNHDNDLYIATSAGQGNSAIIDVTNDSLGTGTGHSFSATFIKTTGGVGSGFLATYDVDSSTGGITSTTIISNGNYDTVPTAFTPTDPYNSSYGTTAATGASITFALSAYDPAEEVIPVQWVAEMEHRNQDTAVLEVAITTNAVPSTITVNATDVFPSSGSIQIGSQIINYTGKTDTTFTGCSHNSGGGLATVHSVGVLVRSYNETYSSQDLTGVKLEINEFGYRDKARAPVASLRAMEEDNWPPLALDYNEEKKKFFETEATDDFFRYITAVGSLYFGAVDADLRFSRYGTPEYWPLEAVITLDSEIKGIKEYAGEGLVFTTNSVYRVRGTDPKAMVAFRVPDAKGVKDGDRHSIAEFNGGLIWKTASDGICMYSSGRVSYLTRDKHNIPDMDQPYACVSDGVYWLFQRPRNTRQAGDTGNGFRLEITSGDLRLCQTTIQAYYAYFAKALGKAIVVTSDPSISGTSTDPFTVQEIGGAKASNLTWRSKKIDAGDPAVSKAFGSIALVYESLDSNTFPTATNGIRGEALAVSLLGLNENELDAGDLQPSALDNASDLFEVFTKYDTPAQQFIADIGGTNWDATKRKTILMPPDFDPTTISAGDSIWHEFLADNTKVVSTGTETVSSVAYKTILLDKEPLRSGTGNVIWGNLPKVHIYINNESTPSRSFALPPIISKEPQSVDLYLDDLRRFRTISIKVEGNVRVNTLSVRHYPVQQYQAQTLHHSADVFYKGVVDFRVKLDGELIFRKELSNAGDEFTEERIYLPSSSFGSRVHYMNESRSGMIESVSFNGSLAA